MTSSLIRLLQAAVGVMTVGLVGYLGRRLGNRAVGNAAALMYARLRPAIFNDAEIEKTAFATFFLLVAVTQSLRGTRTAGLLSGVALGLATLCRANIILLALPLGLYLARGSNGWSLRRAIPLVAGMRARAGAGRLAQLPRRRRARDRQFGRSEPVSGQQSVQHGWQLWATAFRATDARIRRGRLPQSRGGQRRPRHAIRERCHAIGRGRPWIMCAPILGLRRECSSRRPGCCSTTTKCRTTRTCTSWPGTHRSCAGRFQGSAGSFRSASSA